MRYRISDVLAKLRHLGGPVCAEADVESGPNLWRSFGDLAQLRKVSVVQRTEFNITRFGRPPGVVKLLSLSGRKPLFIAAVPSMFPIDQLEQGIFDCIYERVDGTTHRPLVEIAVGDQSCHVCGAEHEVEPSVLLHYDFQSV